MLRFISFTVFIHIYRDRVITPVNIWGDCVGSAIVEHLSREDLLSLDNGRESSETSDCVVDFEINVAVEIEEEDKTKTTIS